MEKISVLIPVFNREKFIERSINSILNQTYQNLEIIIYDDGSTDKTFEMIDQIKTTKTSNIEIRRIAGIKNFGVAYARNILLKMCNTKYAAWMDSDDISHPERIEKQLKVLDENTMVYCTWENLKSKSAGTTRGFATLLFPVNKEIKFPENMNFGAEDAIWREKMEKVYKTTDVNEVLYSIDFHGDRIGSWKRKIDKDWNGVYNLKDLEGLSYEEVLNKYKMEYC